MDTMTCQMDRIYLYTRFERFWHWAQAALIVFLAMTGFEIHGTFSLFGFERANWLHETAGISWFVLYIFIIFWKLTTGEWKQYVPTTKKLFAVVSFYMYGIFKGEDHPVPKSERNKHNPLQRLTYLAIAVALIPVQVATGLLYYTYNSWSAWGLNWHLNSMATIHIAGSFALTAFLIVHVYMITTGHSLTCHVRAMCTGWEDVPRSNGHERLEKAA